VGNYTYVIIELNMEVTTTIYNQPSSQIWGHQGLFDWEYRTFQNDYICGALTRKMGRENQDMMGMQWGCCATMILLILTVILFTSGVLVIIANYHCFLYCNNHRHVHCRCSF